MSYRIVRRTEPTDDDEAAISAPLLAYNRESGPPMRFLPVALAVEDEHGTVSGGVWGYCFYDWLYVEFLSVPAEARQEGLGTRLLAEAEAIAREHGCAGIWLDTFSFQALPFYEKLGFVKFGQIDGHPAGGARYFLQKRLAMPAKAMRRLAVRRSVP